MRPSVPVLDLGLLSFLEALDMVFWSLLLLFLDLVGLDWFLDDGLVALEGNRVLDFLFGGLLHPLFGILALFFGLKLNWRGGILAMFLSLGLPLILSLRGLHFQRLF